MEKLEKEITTKINIFKAIDGTKFDDEQTCLEYESTLEAVLLARLTEVQINEISCEDLFESSGEGIYRIIIPNCMDHIDTLNQLYQLYEGQDKSELLFNKDDINSVILIGIRKYDNITDWIWFWKLNDTISEITNNMFSLIKVIQ